MRNDLEALLPIRPSGSRPPLYCVHPISGSAYPYAAIGQLLDSEQPVYGFESPGFEDGRTPLTSLKALSAEYVEVLGDVAPGGPYFLLGWSMGGAIAFDMAQRLSASGASVPLLVLIDTAVPVKMELPVRKAMLHRFVVDMMGVSGTSPAGLDGIFRGLPDDVAPASVFGAIEGSRLLPPEIDAEFLEDRYRVFRAHIGALFGHEAQGPYRDRVVLIKAAGTPPETMRWGSVAGDVEEHVLPGDHYSIWTGDSLRAMGSIVQQSLDAAQCEHANSGGRK